MITLKWKLKNGHKSSQEFESIPVMLMYLHFYVLNIEGIDEVFSTQDNVIVFYKKGLS